MAENTVTVGEDVAIIVTTTPEQKKGAAYYGKESEGFTQVTPEVLGQSLDGSYKYEFLLEDLRVQAADTAYMAKVVYNDGTESSVLNWSQPGANPSPDDIVEFSSLARDYMGGLTNVLQRVALRKWATPDEVAAIKSLMTLATEVNKIQWADGR